MKAILNGLNRAAAGVLKGAARNSPAGFLAMKTSLRMCIQKSTQVR